MAQPGVYLFMLAKLCANTLRHIGSEIKYTPRIVGDAAATVDAIDVRC